MVPVTLSWGGFEQQVNNASRNTDDSAVMWNGSNIVASHNYANLMKTIGDNSGGDLVIVKVTSSSHDIHMLLHCTDCYQERIGIEPNSEPEPCPSSPQPAPLLPRFPRSGIHPIAKEIKSSKDSDKENLKVCVITVAFML